MSRVLAHTSSSIPRSTCRLSSGLSSSQAGTRPAIAFPLDLLLAGIGERLTRLRGVVKNVKDVKDTGPGGVPVASLVCNGPYPSSFDIRVPIGCSTFDIPR